MSQAASISVVIAPNAPAASVPLAGADEVIIVEDGRRHDCGALGAAAVRRVQSTAPAGQRANIGISLAASDWVVVLTGQERLAPDWIGSLSELLASDGVCAHRLRTRTGGLPLLAVRRPAFAYGALDGRIDNAAAALDHWLDHIFPKHRHRVLAWEGSVDHDVSWLQSGASSAAAEDRPIIPAGASGNGYEPQRFWEEGGRGWVKWEAFQPDEPEIQHIAGRTNPREVLELGCGGGRNGRYFAAAGRYTGLDISLPLLDRARDRQEANSIGLVCGDAVRLPFADASHELVFAVSTLQHVVPDKIAACAGEVARVARRHICLIEFTDELPQGTWFAQPHMFRHEYEEVFAPYARLVERRPTALQVQPAVKHMMLFERR
jgi:hypothetical protein